MTERKRPWWMLHWPSWLALVVFGGAFVVLNLSARVNPVFEQSLGRLDPIAAKPSALVVGWPMPYGEAAYFTPVVARSAAQWLLWPGSQPRPVVVETRWPVLCLDIAIAFASILLSVTTIEAFCSRHQIQITVRSLFLLVGFFCAAASVRLTVTLTHSEALLAWLGVAWITCCLAIGLASLAALDFIGWLFGRLTKREA